MAQHLRIGSVIEDFDTSMTGIDPIQPDRVVQGKAVNVTVSNITPMYLEVEYDFDPRDPNYPGYETVIGLVRTRLWSSFRILED